MKKIIFILMVSLVLVGIVGCNSSNDIKNDSVKIESNNKMAENNKYDKYLSKSFDDFYKDIENDIDTYSCENNFYKFKFKSGEIIEVNTDFNEDTMTNKIITIKIK